MSVTPSAPTVATVIGCQHLNVELGGLPILRDVSLSVGAGEVAAIMGGNGSGKTTLIRALLGLIPHQGGTATLFDQPLAEFRQWRRIGYVPQHGALTMQVATVREVVASGRLAHRRPFFPESRADRDAIRLALTQVDMSDRARDEFVHLSGGQQQRVLIARALATESQLLVMDEPLAGVDVRTQDALAHLVADLQAEGLTIVMVLHDLGPFDDMITTSITLRDGRVCETVGPPPAAHHETVPAAARTPRVLQGPIEGRL